MCSLFSRFVFPLSFMHRCNTHFHLQDSDKQRPEGDDLMQSAKTTYKYTHFTIRNQSPQLLIEYSTWRLPEGLCGQQGHQSPSNDRSTSQLLFSFMCHIQLTVTFVCLRSHSLNPSPCCSQFCRVAPFHLPWLLAMTIFCPGSLDPSW